MRDENPVVTLRVGLDVALGAAELFEALTDELAAALARRGIDFEPGRQGRLLERGADVGVVVDWEPGTSVRLRWHPADWDPEDVTEIELTLEGSDTGTRLTLEHRGWGRQIGDADEIVGWFAGEVAAPLLQAMAPVALGDWLTDRRARRPSGAKSRAVYGDPLYHYPNFRVILQELELKTDDYLLEIGCGGGVLVRDALLSGCRAAAVDHSAEMVQLAQDTNGEAVIAGRLSVHQAGADRLPFDDDTFTCAAMTGVLGFLSDPVAAFREIRRVLRGGGRFVTAGSDPRLRGTPAAPEPMASRLRFYEPEELEGLAREAGFGQASVVRRDLETFAREAGVPEEHLGLFAGSPAAFLVARKAAE